MTTQEYEVLLEQTFTIIDNDKRKEAEKELIQKAINDQHAFEKLLQLLCSAFRVEVQRWAGVFLNSVVKKLLQEKVNPYQIDTQMKQLSLLIQALHQPIAVWTRESINTVITTFLTQDRTNALRPIVKAEIVKQFQSSDIKNIEIGLLLWQSMVSTIELYKLMGTACQDLDWVQGFALKGRELVNGITEILRAEVVPQDQTQNNTLLSTLKCVQSWSSGAAQLIKKVCGFKGFPKEYILEFQNFLINSQELAMSFFTLMLITVKTQNQLRESFISTTGDSILDKILNESKSDILQSYNQLLKLLFGDRPRQESRKSPLVSQLTHLLPQVMYSIVVYSSKYPLLEAIQDETIQCLLTNICAFITHCGGQTEYYCIMNQMKISMLFDVILPLLSTNSAEYQKLVDEPEEFVNLALDTIDKQESNIPKTAAAQMLEMYCDHIDGSTTQVSQIAVAIIVREIDQQTGQTIYLSIQLGQAVGQVLQYATERYFFNGLTSVQRIDSCLVALTVMSYLLSRRSDIIQLLETVLQEYTPYFSNDQLDPLIRSRFALFFGYYCDNLFKTVKNNEKLLRYVQVLIDQLRPVQHTWYLAVMYQSVDALKNIFEDDELTPLVRTIILNIFNVVVQSLLSSHYDQHFEMVQSVFKMYSNELSSNKLLFLQGVKLVIQKVVIEQQKVNDGFGTHAQYVQKSMNILRSICEYDGYNVDLLVALDQELVVLYQILENQSTKYDEDIIFIVTQLVKKTQQVSINQQRVFLLLPQLMSRQQNRLGELFIFLNCLLKWGANMWRSIDTQNILFNMALTALNNQLQDINESDQGEGALLLHLGIQHIGQNIDTAILQKVFQGIVTRSGSPIKNGFLRGRLMGVFLCALFVDFERSKDLLQQMGALEQVVQQLPLTQNIYSSGYEIKLYIVTVSYLLVKIPQLFTTNLIQCMVQLLMKQQKQEESNHFRQDQGNSSDDDDDDDDEMDDFNENENEDLSEAKLVYDDFKSDIMQIDEYQSFTKMIHEFKQHYPESIQMLRQQLTQDDIQQLQNIISCVRVEEAVPPRRIVQIKKRKNPNA